MTIKFYWNDEFIYDYEYQSLYLLSAQIYACT